MRITPEQAADGPLSFARAMRLDRFHKAVLIIVNAETAPDLSLDRREEVQTVTQTLLEVLEDLFHLQMSFFFTLSASARCCTKGVKYRSNTFMASVPENLKLHETLTKESKR